VAAASVSITKGREKSGKVGTGGEVRAVYSVANAG